MTLSFPIRSLIVITTGCVLSTYPLVAQTTSAPAGLVGIRCLANSDTYVSIPFIRSPQFTGVVQSVSGGVIAVDAGLWAPSQFVYAGSAQRNTYYVLIGENETPNTKTGRRYRVIDNSVNTVTIDPEQDDISDIPANTRISIIPYWTLSTAFPPEDSNHSFIPSSSPFIQPTQVLIPNYSGNGINLSTSATYLFLNSGWRVFGRPLAEDHGDDILDNGRYFVIRNAGTATTFITRGTALRQKETIGLRTSTSTRQDNQVAVTRPIGVSLNNIGLLSSGAFAPSTSPFIRADELYVFDNAAVGYNKSAAATYYYYNNAWRRFGQPLTTDFGGTIIPPGTGVLIRKNVTSDGAKAF